MVSSAKASATTAITTTTTTTSACGRAAAHSVPVPSGGAPIEGCLGGASKQIGLMAPIRTFNGPAPVESAREGETCGVIGGAAFNRRRLERKVSPH